MIANFATLPNQYTRPPGSRLGAFPWSTLVTGFTDIAKSFAPMLIKQPKPDDSAAKAAAAQAQAANEAAQRAIQAMQAQQMAMSQEQARREAMEAAAARARAEAESRGLPWYAYAGIAAGGVFLLMKLLGRRR